MSLSERMPQQLAIGGDEQPAVAAALHPHQRIERIG